MNSRHFCWVNSMKDRKKPAIRFKGFTEDWEQRKLGDVVGITSGFMGDSLLSDGKYHLTRIETIADGIVDENRVGYSNEKPDDMYLLKHGDILYSNINSISHMGKVAKYQGNSPLYHGINLLRLQPENNINSDFLLYLLNTEKCRNWAKTRANQAVSQASINQSLLTTQEIAISSFEEQKKIGDYFRNLDNLITLHQCKLKLLKQIKQSMENGLFIKNTTKNRKELENMTFKYESDFEETLINLLSNKGWEKDVIKYPTESELLQNWANILFDNNRGIDRLNNYPLTEGEMQQILEQINSLSTPIKLNEFINGKTVSIKRDNPDDLEHLGKEVSLKIYDRREIAAGQSRYQIVQQPVFPSKSKILNDRRGDLMLLINGMPVIHIELKKSGIPVSQACNQIEKYSKEGIFTGLFSLVQVFVAMTLNETRYFANPGPDGRFNSDYYFKWADFNNEPINDWKEIASSLLSIPMAHQLIGFYTIADESDGILKVMRSYQYYAANAISDKVAKIKWDESNQRGGFIWHTTGSGKTMTSFKLGTCPC